MEATGKAKRREGIKVKDFLKVPFYMARGIKYHAAGHLYTPKPLFASLRVTDRCNSKCLMCTSWKKSNSEEELALFEIREVCRNPLFNSLNEFNLTGGEPTLREDLVEIARTVMDSCPQLPSLGLYTNGLEPDLILKRVQAILALPRIKSLSQFTVSVSLDGYGDVHGKVRRVPQAFERTTETIKRLKALQSKIPFKVRSTCVVQSANAENILQLWEFTQQLDLPITFVPARDDIAHPEYFQETIPNSSVRLTSDHCQQLEELFCHRLKSELPLSMVIAWQENFKILAGNRRRSPCFLARYQIELGSNGIVNMCCTGATYGSSVLGNVRQESIDRIWYSKQTQEAKRKLTRDICPTCYVTCNMAFSLREEFFYAAGSLLKGKIKDTLTRITEKTHGK